MDINTQDLHNELKVSDSEEHEGNIKGIIYGRFLRFICTATVCIKKKIKFMHFIIDTGSPIMYPSEDTLTEFGLFNSTPIYKKNWQNLKKEKNHQTYIKKWNLKKKEHLVIK